MPDPTEPTPRPDWRPDPAQTTEDRIRAGASAGESTPRQAPASADREGSGRPSDSDQAGAKPTDIAESDFLQRQMNEAAAALSDAWKKAQANLVHGVHPTTLTREHPWIALGSAAVAGFVAAATVVPSKEDQAIKRLAKLERALGREPVAANGHAATARSEPAKPTWMQEIFKTLRPALMSALSAAISSKMTAEHVTDPEKNPAMGAAVGAQAQQSAMPTGPDPVTFDPNRAPDMMG